MPLWEALASRRSDPWPPAHPSTESNGMQLEDCQPSTLDIPSDKLQYHPEQKDPSHPGLTGAAFSSLTQQRLEQKKRKEMARQSKVCMENLAQLVPVSTSCYCRTRLALLACWNPSRWEQCRVVNRTTTA